MFRTRKEILADDSAEYEAQILETLLDIRDLLKPEIIGVPITNKEQL